ncbi:MAG: glycosyltransferase family 9 protein [Planctomycetes bacterium]|jgi:heptosyltransferase-3|nr:glycosyltransferase family 9 protein [Planctomycetota bacterium]MCC7064484.1 glycosyltransferase family 9 protein [Planctomycetota bacterium]
MHDVLVVRRGGLGDTLLMTPMLRALRRQWPAARLCLAGVREHADVLREFGVVDEVWSSEDLHLWVLGSDGAAGQSARRRLGEFDCVIADEPLPGLGARPQVRAFDVRTLVPGVPFGLQIAQQLGGQLGLACEWPADAWLCPPGAGVANGPIVLAPGSGGRAKCWPREHWLVLGAALHGDGHSLAIVGGPVEQERDDPEAWAWPPGTRFYKGLPLVALAQALRGARWFVGNDSGPSHLAAMLGVPTVVLFGPTDARVWAPVGPHVRVLEAPLGVLQALRPETVLERCPRF